MCSVLFCVGCTTPVLAQRIQFGLQAGVPMTEYFRTGSMFSPGSATIQYSSATRRYTFGLASEWRLYKGLRLEVDAQYRRMGYVHNENFSFSSDGEVGTTVYEVKGSSWDFPIMAKYRLGRSRRPYVTGGYVIRHIGPVRARGVKIDNLAIPTRQTVITPIDTDHPDELTDFRNFTGLTVGIGFEFGGGRLRFSPELRYTHWLSNLEYTPRALDLRPDQAEFLLGIVFLRR